MGLAEKRAQQSFEEGTLKELTQKVEEIVGKGVDFEINWETIALNDYAHLYEKAWSNMYFRTLIKALQNIAIDDMGKQALSEKLNKVKIQNTASISHENYMASFEGGTLTLDHMPFSNIPDPDSSDGEGDMRFRDRVAAIQGVIEKNL